jgi:hypothetical protein
MRSQTRRPVLAACLLALASLTEQALPSVAATQTSTECEGEACSSVTLTFDDEKQQYLVRNNSSDRWARVSASNLAAAVSACVAPGKDEYLPLKSVVAPYRAVYAEARCGAPAGVG